MQRTPSFDTEPVPESGAIGVPSGFGEAACEVPRLDPDKELNSEQAAAVRAPDGPTLVIAAAGTGKTRTLTWRVAWLVERGVDPRGILLLTFTNRASREMMDRARALVGDAVGGVWGGTFHHMCNRVLRRHAPAIGYGCDFTILDEDDTLSLVRACINELGLREKHFPKADVLRSLFSLARNRAISLDQAIREHFRDAAVEAGDIRRVLDAFTARKRQINGMDFDDLLIETLRLFDEQPAILLSYQDRFQHVLVDEYQDTNPIQARLVDLLAARHRNLFVVGDDFQSIYSWRGADFRNFLSFPDRYPNTRIFKLETNYRSLPGILDVANAAIAGNPDQFQKTLRPVRISSARPVLAELRDGSQQAAYVIEQIRNARREGIPSRDIAVLYRSHFHAMEMQLELSRQRIPFSITSGIRFFEQAHIKDACSLLRLIQNPGDEPAFLRLLGLLPRVGEKTALRIWSTLGGRFALRLPEARAAVGKALPAVAREDWKVISAIFEDLPSETLDRQPGEIVYRFLSGFYSAHAEATFDNAERRIEDLEELVNFLGRFAHVGEFLSDMALMSNVDENGARGGAGTDSILLSTIHQAKGLEWNTVIVLWLAEGLFPSKRSLDERDTEAEERRLFYVATTRARDTLILCSPRRRQTRDQGMVYYAPSRFLGEIPPTLVRVDRSSLSMY
ncbi:MAG: ATP-dependent helicase [Kiritimatiellia bacterium]|nr:ATP-dependent helicase [Kiritimatiellia bacterium]